MPLITEPGAYADISAEDYHGNPHLLPGPSLSASGAKKILNESPYHFWFASPLNPEPPEEDSAPHLNIGKAAHDVILLTDRWPEFYHVTPEGFSKSATKKFEDAIAECENAEKAGKTILRYQDHKVVQSVANRLRANELAMSALSNGVAEETIVWKDPITGVWLRCRPDFRPASIAEKRAVRIVADLKFVAPTHASPSGFSKMVSQFGYHQQAAFYSDGIEAVYGVAPTHWLFVVVEKEAPFSISFYELAGEDIERGRVLNRRAINLFAKCLKSGKWPGYADQPAQVGIPEWDRKKIDAIDPAEMAYAAAA